MSKAATILFVDDDPYIRKVLCAYLQRCGFEVLSAADGADGLEVARNFKGEIRMLISDVMMPGMTGPELAGTLRLLRPKLKVLLITASADFPMAGADMGWEFLRKPFAPAVLLEKVQQLIPDDPPAGPKPSPDEVLHHRMREARTQYVRYSQEYDLLLALTGSTSASDPERIQALRQAAQVRKSTLHAYAESVRQFADFLSMKQAGQAPPAKAAG